MSEYNGWTNRETWLVGLWFEPETISDVNYLEEYLSEEHEKLPGFFKDCIDLDAINWEELRESKIDDSEEVEQETA